MTNVTYCHNITHHVCAIAKAMAAFESRGTWEDQQDMESRRQLAELARVVTRQAIVTLRRHRLCLIEVVALNHTAVACRKLERRSR